MTPTSGGAVPTFAATSLTTVSPVRSSSSVATIGNMIRTG